MKKNMIIALGFFDGVHLGHQALLSECVRLAREMDAKTAAITFEQHPQSLFRADVPPAFDHPGRPGPAPGPLRHGRGTLLPRDQGCDGHALGGFSEGASGSGSRGLRLRRRFPVRKQGSGQRP